MEPLDKPPTDEVMVKVKFNGSKLAMGSSKIATAVVPVPFMHNITQLNKAMLERIVVLTSKKKNQDRGLGLISNHNKKRKLTAACSSNGYVQEIEDLPRNPTQGGLCLPQDHPISTINSIYYPLQSNRKLFQKAVEDIDIDSMPISCDFDFWLWLEAQKIFSPFSYKTHDLNTIAMQDVGHKEVLSRWCMPAFHSPATTTPDVNHTTTMNSCSSNSSSNNNSNINAAGSSAVVSTGDRGMVAQYATTTSRGIDDDVSSTAHIPCAQAPAGCVWKSTTTITTTTREETAMSSSSPSQAFPNLPPLPSQQQQLQQVQQTEAPFVLPKGYTDLDEHIQKLKSQLLHENLEINQKLTRLRCNSLQTIPIRTELEESMKQIEKERLILLKWRKSKSYIPPGGINLNNTSMSNNYIGNIKGKSNYKRKHSSY